MQESLLNNKTLWQRWIEESQQAEMGKERPSFVAGRNNFSRGFMLISSLWFCGWEMDRRETKRVDCRVVLKKNGCKMVIDNDVAEFTAPYLKRPVIERVCNLVGMYMVRREIPMFGEDHHTLDLMCPEKGLSPAHLLGYDRELRAMLKQLTAFIQARKRYPGTGELVKWCAATTSQSGLHGRWSYLHRLIRRGEGKVWIKVRVRDGHGKMLIVPLHRKALAPDVERQLMKQQTAPLRGRGLWK